MVSDSSLGLLAGGAVGAILVVFVVVYLLRTYRLRRLAELRNAEGGRAGGADRAYNRLALARREADLLEAQGTDVSRARQLIDLASRSLDQRQSDRAYELAQAAHETLVQARRQPRLRSGSDPAPAVALPSSPPTPLATTPAPVASSPPPAPVPAVAKNRAEAQFELRLLDQDLAQAGAKGGNGSSKEARELSTQAHAAFDKGEFADAFRLAIRGRRKVGATFESLGGGTAVPPTPPAPLDPGQTAEATAAAGRCAQCGHPLVAGDGFCRGCGAPTGAPCPKCGSPRRPGDTFCGKCGAPAG